MANFSTDWPFHLAATLLGLLALFILYRSLLHNRSRGRRRCPKCWYDMSGADASREKGLVCPECGRDAKRERRLYKTRRYKRWTLVWAVMALGAYGVFMAPRVRRDGVLPHVPTTALIIALPWLDKPTADVQRFAHLGRASTSVALSGSEEVYLELVARAHADWPGSRRDAGWPQWQRRMLWRRVLGVERSASLDGRSGECDAFLMLMSQWGRKDPLASRAAMEIIARRSVKVRPRLPSGATALYAVDYIQSPAGGASSRVLRVSPDWPDAEDYERRLNPHGSPLQAAWYWPILSGPEPADGRIRIGELPSGRNWIFFSLSIHEDGREVWRGRIRRSINVGGAVDQILTPVADPSIDRLLASAPMSIVRCDETGRAALIIAFWEASSAPNAKPRAGVAPPPTGPSHPTVGTRVTILDRERPIAGFVDGAGSCQTTHGWVRFNEVHALESPSGPSVAVWRFVLSDEIDWGDEKSQFAIHLTSDPSVALRDIGADGYWLGDLIVPVSVLSTPRREFDARLKVGEYLLPGIVDPWADPAALRD